MRSCASKLFLCLLFVAGCGSTPAEPLTGGNARQRAGTSAQKARTLPSLPATELARVPSGTFGPYLSHGPQSSLVVWAAVGQEGGALNALLVSREGQPLGKPRSVASTSPNLRLVAVRSGEAGFFIAHSELGNEHETVSAICLDGKGVAVGPAVSVASSKGRVVWVEAIETKGGALVFYGEMPDERKLLVEISVVPLDRKCQPQERVTLSRDARAWQAVPLADGALLATVRAASVAGGNVEATLVGENGAARATTSVSSERSAEADIDAVRMGDRALLAWTDRRSLEARLFGAALDSSGKLLAPAAPLTEAEGEQALLQLVPPAPGGQAAYVAWENLSERRSSGRVFQLSAVDTAGALTGPRGTLEYSSMDGRVPELSATANGLGALTIAPACLRQGRCDEGAVAPIFVELDASFVPRVVEPLRLEPLGGAPAEIGFNLACTARGCLALAALARDPAPVYAAQLTRRSSAFRSPAGAVDTTKTPRVVTHQALTSLSSCAAFALESAAGQEYLATITDFDPTTPWQRLTRPAPDGRFEPLRARIDVERLGSLERKTQPVRASPISLRGHSLGGVTLAPGHPDRGELLVAWAGVDQGTPQIFLTLLSKNGDRLGQRMLTRKKGDLGDIAATWVGDGWVIAWVDERFDDLEVFAAKVDARLGARGPEQRITQVPGAAAEPALAWDSANLRLVWSDSRDADSAGHADVYSVLVDARDAKPKGPEVRLAATRAHSFSPVVQANGPGSFAVAWAERGEDGSDPGSVASVSVTTDGTVSALRVLSASGAEPRAVALACTGPSCRLAAIVEAQNQASLAVASIEGQSPAGALVPVLSLLGTAGVGVSPLLRGDDVLFVDGSAEEARVRRARLAW